MSDLKVGDKVEIIYIEGKPSLEGLLGVTSYITLVDGGLVAINIKRGRYYFPSRFKKID